MSADLGGGLMGSVCPEWPVKTEAQLTVEKVMVHESFQTELSADAGAVCWSSALRAGWEGGTGHDAALTANWPACEKPGVPSPVPMPFEEDTQ